MLRRWRGDEGGFTLVELMAVVVILGVLASVVVQTVPDAVARARRSALAANLAGLQGAVDRFFADTSAFPTYSGSVPADQPASREAREIVGQAAYPGEPERCFVGSYVHFLPTDDAVTLGLDTTVGAHVYWGVVRSGLVFCTQVPPEDGGWYDGSAVVHTQEAPAGQRLADIWER